MVRNVIKPKTVCNNDQLVYSSVSVDKKRLTAIISAFNVHGVVGDVSGERSRDILLLASLSKEFIFLDGFVSHSEGSVSPVLNEDE